jgi:hypothetical protein
MGVVIIRPGGTTRLDQSRIEHWRIWGRLEKLERLAGLLLMGQLESHLFFSRQPTEDRRPLTTPISHLWHLRTCVLIHVIVDDRRKGPTSTWGKCPQLVAVIIDDLNQ